MRALVANPPQAHKRRAGKPGRNQAKSVKLDSKEVQPQKTMTTMTAPTNGAEDPPLRLTAPKQALDLHAPFTNTTPTAIGIDERALALGGPQCTE